MNRLDYLILNLLEANSANSPIKGMTVDELAEEIERFNANITIYKRIKFLLDQNYVSKGIKAGKANTYYITKTGTEIKLKGEESI